MWPRREQLFAPQNTVLTLPWVPPLNQPPYAGLGGFWEAAAGGAILQRPVPHQRWDLDWCYSADAVLGKSYARFAAFTEVRGLPAFHVLYQAGWRDFFSQPSLCCHGLLLSHPLSCLTTLPGAACRGWTCLTAPSSA